MLPMTAIMKSYCALFSSNFCCSQEAHLPPPYSLRIIHRQIAPIYYCFFSYFCCRYW